jgi:hypothetical protein
MASIPPSTEIDRLERTRLEAVDHARGGHPDEGLRLLLAGLVTALDAQARGAPWGRDLADHWREAVEDFRREHIGYVGLSGEADEAAARF